MTHEEADIIMAYNTIEVSFVGHSAIRVVSDDTDVFIILMHQLQARAYNLPATVKVTMEACSGENSSDYHKDKTSLHQLYLVSCNWNKCHNAHAARVISLALRSVSAWVEQRVKLPLHADRFRIATAKVEWFVITSTLSQSNVI